MTNQSPIIRFGITSDGKRSSYWRLRAGLAKPELFLEREDYGKKFHFSLHASGQWHMVQGGKERISWTKPDEFVPGYTRVFGIVQPVGVAVREDAASGDVELVPVAAGAEGKTFSVFLERPGANLDNSWPGKNADGTTLVGRPPARGWCWDLLRRRPGRVGSDRWGGVPSPERGRAALDA